MAQPLDLSLPAHAPTHVLTQTQTSDSQPVALYTLLPLSDEELRRIVTACNHSATEYGSEPVRLAPEPRYASRTLREIYEIHLQLVSDGSFEVEYFVVVVKEDWKKDGVLLVTLANNDEPPAIDSMMGKVEELGLTLLNLQIANTDWDECLEELAIVSEEEPEKQEERPEMPTDANEDQSEDEGPHCPPGKPPYEFLIPMYFADVVDARTTIASLEDRVQTKSDPLKDYQIRDQGTLLPIASTTTQGSTADDHISAYTDGLVSQACALHPVRCRTNKWLHKTCFLICDTMSPSRYGLIVVKLSWDGIAKGRSKQNLREIGTAATREYKRIPGARSDVPVYYNLVARDIAIFERKHPAFGVFWLNTESPRQDIEIVDNQFLSRQAGDAFLLLAPRVVHRDFEPSVYDPTWTLDNAISRFQWFCYSSRFEALLSRQYFLFVDFATASQSGVVIVRYDWDENIDKDEKALWNASPGDAVRTHQVQAAVALDMLYRAEENGSDDWEWETYLARI